MKNNIFYKFGIKMEGEEKLRKKGGINMKRKRKNQRREKMIMIGSSVFVLTALTMTGIYVKEKNQIQDDGYVVDLSQLEINDMESTVPEVSDGALADESEAVLIRGTPISSLNNTVLNT